ncbi:MAG: 1-aminocyclopropane-1-carboxylate deaminase/D-cysteine desulfhydrase [Anaerolineae bacterium]|jgi:1-aminocyclopropane-1-carboxylate deaminase/D-cysteine desulfhydrase-like pyridoxal-dependent ACC family enzyme
MSTPLPRALFQAYPGLFGRIPWMPLADLPTPLERMDHLSAGVGADLWVKRDGLTHPIYGGNKIRKFEFVFADVLRRGARAVLTGGGLGSHHTLATAVIARQLGLQPVCSYYCQPISEEVRLNLRRSVLLGIDAHFCGDYVGLALSFVREYARWLVKTRRPPYFIYPGASGTLGVLGYVNAAFEIQVQLQQLGEREPEAVFCAVGSCGTFAGLLLGARLAGLQSRIVGVPIIEEDQANAPKIARMANRAARVLHRHDPAVPAVRFQPGDVALVEGYMGAGYAHPTTEALDAIQVVTAAEGLSLEGTYTGKAMAALLDYAHDHPGSRLLFVDTFAEAPLLPEGGFHDLPRPFWPVFDRSQKARCWCLRAWRDPAFCWKRRR